MTKKEIAPSFIQEALERAYLEEILESAYEKVDGEEDNDIEDAVRTAVKTTMMMVNAFKEEGLNTTDAVTLTKALMETGSRL